MSAFRRIQIYSIFLISLSVLFFSSCQRSKFDADVSGIEADIRIRRFEKDLFGIDQNRIKEEALRLERSYPVFYQLYFEHIMRFGRITDTAYLNVLKDFLNHKDILSLKHDVDSVYPDLATLEKDLSNAFKHYKYYFPKNEIPEVISFISAFENGIVNTDSLLAIGLDLFLGKRYKYYPSAGFPQYRINQFIPENIVPSAMKGFAKSMFEENTADRTMLDKMIYEGRILYFLDAVTPDISDTLKIGYTAAQLQWCKEYEVAIWSLFIDRNLLFSTDELAYNKYIVEAPFTAGLENDSAPMIGVWAGWQIVRKYMDENPKVTLTELMNETDYQKVLKLSKYKPK